MRSTMFVVLFILLAQLAVTGLYYYGALLAEERYQNLEDARDALRDLMFRPGLVCADDPFDFFYDVEGCDKKKKEAEKAFHKAQALYKPLSKFHSDLKLTTILEIVFSILFTGVLGSVGLCFT